MMTFRCFLWESCSNFFSFFPVFAENRLGNLYLNSFHTCPDDSARFDVFSVCLPEKLTNHTE